MNINEKIEEIRRKPESERVKYVWGMVAISMFFIIVLWVVSLKDTFSRNYSPSKDLDNTQGANIESAINLER